MNTGITVILWTSALLAALLLNFTLRAKSILKFLGLAAFLTALGGIALYGYGYACTEESTALVVLKSIYAVCGIFVGQSGYGDIAAAPLFQFWHVQALFWVLHIFGLFASLGAVVSTLGATLLHRIQLMLSQRGSLALIYGLHPDSLGFAQKLMEQGKQSVVFVDPAPDAGCAETAAEMGCLLCSDADALAANRRFLTQLGLRPGKRFFSLYALREDPAENQSYALQLKQALKEKGISPTQTALTILGQESDLPAALQAGEEQDGYGSVLAVNTAEMAARMMIRGHCPWNTLSFDERGLAQEDLHALIVGFGQMGQTVLRQLVMNGQFAGSCFRADVFDPAYEQTSGYFAQRYGKMLAEYDIRFYPHDGRSQEFFRYLQENRDSIRYIAICTGSEKSNLEMEMQLSRFFGEERHPCIICQCSHHALTFEESSGQFGRQSIYVPEILSGQLLDRRAMVLNHSYCGSGTPEENWKRCDYFSRMSSRASADFVPALLRAAGSSEEEILQKAWEPQGELLENLARTEHLRWNAFHYAMGFAPMPEELWYKRAEQYRQELESLGKSRLRIGKDMVARQHACMIAWEELDELSRREALVTGKAVDYKQADRNNVLAMAEVIRAARS